jgi:hypothetical protein
MRYLTQPARNDRGPARENATTHGEFPARDLVKGVANAAKFHRKPNLNNFVKSGCYA